MKQHDNDDSPTWISIGVQAKLILNKLRVQAQLAEGNEEQTEPSKRDPEPGDADEQKRAEHRKAVEQRLRDLAAFERRVGNKN